MNSACSALRSPLSFGYKFPNNFSGTQVIKVYMKEKELIFLSNINISGHSMTVTIYDPMIMNLIVTIKRDSNGHYVDWNLPSEKIPSYKKIEYIPEMIYQIYNSKRVISDDLPLFHLDSYFSSFQVSLQKMMDTNNCRFPKFITVVSEKYNTKITVETGVVRCHSRSDLS